MAKVIIYPRIVRGTLFWFVGDTGFATFAQAVSAWSAAECHRLDIVEVRHA